MKTSTMQARNFRPTIGRIAMALAVASAVGGLSMMPAFGDNDARQGHRDNGARGGERHVDRAHDRRGRGPAYRPGYRQPYVYAPPPIYYPPRPSPGVSLFFPLDIRVR